ncbi:hypothetical protein MRX96_048945 [Rhipicephalus microplus]
MLWTFGKYPPETGFSVPAKPSETSGYLFYPGRPIFRQSTTGSTPRDTRARLSLTPTRLTPGLPSHGSVHEEDRLRPQHDAVG